MRSEILVRFGEKVRKERIKRGISNEWIVSKAAMNEEISFHDTDIRVFHKRTGKTVRVECKLAKKEGYQLHADGHSEIRVKF